MAQLSDGELLLLFFQDTGWSVQYIPRCNGFTKITSPWADFYSKKGSDERNRPQTFGFLTLLATKRGFQIDLFKNPRNFFSTAEIPKVDFWMITFRTSKIVPQKWLLGLFVFAPKKLPFAENLPKKELPKAGRFFWDIWHAHVYVRFANIWVVGKSSKNPPTKYMWC